MTFRDRLSLLGAGSSAPRPRRSVEALEALAEDGSNQQANVVLVGDGVAPGAAASTAAGPARLERPISVEQVLEIMRTLGIEGGERARVP